MTRFVFAFCICASAFPLRVVAQQVVDSAFRPTVAAPAFATGSGPVVLFDEAHNSFHSLGRSFRPFAELLRLDGYRVAPLETKLSGAALSGADVLVIVNVLAKENVDNWKLPTPSAYTPDEIEAVRRWVSAGGSLLLVADHMPFPGAARDLAHALGFTFANNFAIDTAKWGPLVFRRQDGTLASHPITSGRSQAEKIDSVMTFTGQAFRGSDSSVAPLLVLRSGVVTYEPAVAWQFDGVPASPAEGLLQAAARTFGVGRVVVLGEAAMLTAQLAGRERLPMGMNHPGARQNQQFTLNVMHWLDGTLPESARAARSPNKNRRALIGLVSGLAIGAVVGAAANDPDRQGGIGYSPPSKGENVIMGAVFGGTIGWLLGRYLFSR